MNGDQRQPQPPPQQAPPVIGAGAESVLAPDAAPLEREAKTDIWRSTCVLPHMGQFTAVAADSTKSSNGFVQSVQTYS